MTQNKHRIRKVLIEVETHSMEKANSIKNNIHVFIETELLPIIEEEFNALGLNDDSFFQLDKLNITFSSIEKNKFDSSQIRKEIQQQLVGCSQKTVNSIASNQSERIISGEEKKVEAFNYFLTKGILPWWFSNNNEIFNHHYLSTVAVNEGFIRKFKTLITENAVQNRLIRQFTSQEIITMTTKVFDNNYLQKSSSNNPVLYLINEGLFDTKVSFWKSIFQYYITANQDTIIQFYLKNKSVFLSSKISFELYITAVSDILNVDIKKAKKDAKVIILEENSTPKLTINRENKNKDESNIEDFQESLAPTTATILENKNNVENNSQEETSANNSDHSSAFYVQNAGLILLHPFVKELFKKCDLLNENNQITNKELATHILHYAATKKENDFEHTMLFEKFLCNLPIQQSIRREISISAFQKQQVEEVIQTVIKYWEALKNTSSDIVRTEFLQREGKLDLTENNPKLSIERKTQDILLEKIPWNISIVKVPWQEKLIYTNW